MSYLRVQHFKVPAFVMAVICLFLCQWVLAQKNNVPVSVYSLDHTVARENVSFQKATIKNVSEAESYLKEKLINFRNNSGLPKLLHVKNSIKGRHYQFEQTINGIPVYRGLIKLNTDLNGNVISVFDNSFAINASLSGLFPDEIIVRDELAKYTLIDNYNISKIYFPDDGALIPALRLELTTNNDISEEKIFNEAGKMIYYRDLNSYYLTGTDTLVQVTVFSPDPITTAATMYGNPFYDNGDSSNTQIENQMFVRDMQVLFDSGTFVLSNRYVKIQEHSPPSVAAVTSNIPEFHYNRYEPGFEDVNAMYHITQMQLYLQSLGDTDVVNYQIGVDTHGLNGADNSVFTSTSNPPRLTFGEGGVDDAEDADVVIHEYGHAISYSCAPGTNSGSQRQAMDEGMGDYFASVYSRMENNYKWYNVFAWDGHNEFWGGRVSNSSMHYPNNLTNQIHTDGQIWSSVLMEISNDLGPDTTTKILIEAMHSFASNMSMSAAAQLYIQADSLLYGGLHYTTICTYFYNRGLCNTCESYTGIGTQAHHISKPVFYPNPTSGKLYVSDKYDFIEVYDISGSMIYKGFGASIDLDAFAPGLYLCMAYSRGTIVAQQKVVLTK